MAREQVHRPDPDHTSSGTRPPEQSAPGESLEELQQRVGNQAVHGLVGQPPGAQGETVQRLQRSFGNQAVRGLLRQPRPVAPKKQTGLPDRLKSGVEALSGVPLDDVTVHYNSAEPAELDALAYTQGNDIHLAPGQAQHLPHEAWHVVQQAQGRVQPEARTKKGVPVNDDQGLEHEADVMAARAVAHTEAFPGEPERVSDAISATPSPPVARVAQRTVEVNLVPVTVAPLALSPLARATFLEWVADATPRPLASQQELIARVTEAAEEGHTVARHGPEVENVALQKRLFTGIAPDNRLSPAPGASSRFATYADLLTTRQAATTAVATAISAAQNHVLAWRNTVLVPGVPVAIATARTDEHTTATANVGLALQGIAEFKRINRLDALNTEIKALEEDLAGRMEDREAVASELEGPWDMETSTRGAAATGDDATALTLQQDALTDQIAGIAKLLSEKQRVLAMSDQGRSDARELHLGAIRVQGTARDAQTAAESDRDFPGRTLKTYLNQKCIGLNVDDTVPATTFALGANVRLLGKYSVLVTHGQSIGSGATAAEADAVALTAIVSAVEADPQPKSYADIVVVLQGMGLVSQLEALAAFLDDPVNLALAKTKEGAKVYKTVAHVASLDKTFTNFEVTANALFDGANHPNAPDTSAWKVIQHFPTADPKDGVQERS